MKDARKPGPRWVDFMHPANPHGLRFAEGGEPAGGAGDSGKGSDDKGGDPQPDPAPDPKDGDEPLGDGGKRALEAEREARRNLEGQMNQMREAFAAALGQKPDKKASVEDMVAGLQSQLASMQRTTLVATIARENELTSTEDIEALEGAKDEDAMRRIAARLKASNAPSTPKPDRSQGGTGQTPKPDVKPGMSRLRYAYSSSDDN